MRKEHTSSVTSVLHQTIDASTFVIFVWYAIPYYIYYRVITPLDCNKQIQSSGTVYHTVHACIPNLEYITPSDAIWRQKTFVSFASRNTWWRHPMETFSALLAPCASNSPITGDFPAQRPVMWSLCIFFDLRLNKRLGKQSSGWSFETPSHPLWRQSNETHHLNSTKPNCLTQCPIWQDKAKHTLPSRWPNHHNHKHSNLNHDNNVTLSPWHE